MDQCTLYVPVIGMRNDAYVPDNLPFTSRVS